MGTKGKKVVTSMCACVYQHTTIDLTFYSAVRCLMYRSGTVNSKSFVGQVLLRIKWKFELTVHFKNEMLGKL